MTIIRPETFQRHLPAGYDGLFDWDFLLPAFAPTNIKPMDLDALVERQGHFLVFETKNPGVPIPDAQRLALDRLILRGRGAIRAIILNAKHPSQIDGWQVWGRHGNEVLRLPREGNASALVASCRKWFEAVSARPPPLWHQHPIRKQSDLFADLIADPVELATLHLEALPRGQRAMVLARFTEDFP
jgi:hypothetical protein